MMETSRVSRELRRIVLSVFCALLATYASGCASRGNVELLEAQLRTQERELRSAQNELDAAQSELSIARQDARALRTQLASNDKNPLLPEQADALFRATGIRLNSMLTGGLDRDEQPGDDILAVALVPHDANDEPVKLPGEIKFELYDMTRPKAPEQIGVWSYSIEDSHTAWQRGLLGAGYRFQLPLKQPPETSELVLHARLTTADRRLFDTNTVLNLKPRPDVLVDAESATEEVPAIVPEVIQVKHSATAEAPKADDLPPFEEADAIENDEFEPIRTSDSWMEADIPSYR